VRNICTKLWETLNFEAKVEKVDRPAEICVWVLTSFRSRAIQLKIDATIRYQNFRPVKAEKPSNVHPQPPHETFSGGVERAFCDGHSGDISTGAFKKSRISRTVAALPRVSEGPW
jgi:hypothetical protein